MRRALGGTLLLLGACSGDGPPLPGSWEGNASGSQLIAPLHAVVTFEGTSAVAGRVHMLFDAPRGTSGEGCLSTIAIEGTWSSLRQGAAWQLELAGSARTQIASCVEATLDFDRTENYRWGPFVAEFSGSALTLTQVTPTAEQRPLRVELMRR